MSDPHDVTSITLALRTLGNFDFEGIIIKILIKKLHFS